MIECFVFYNDFEYLLCTLKLFINLLSHIIRVQIGLKNMN